MKLDNLTPIMFLLGAAGVGLSVWGWHAESVKRALAEARAVQLADSLTRTGTQLDSVRTAFRHREAAWAIDTLRLTHQIADARRTIAGLSHRGDSLGLVLVRDTTAADSLATLTVLADIRLQEARSCRTALDTALALYDGCTGLLGRADSLLVAEHAQRVATERLAEEWRKAARPGWLAKLWRGVPYLAAGVVVGVVLAQ